MIDIKIDQEDKVQLIDDNKSEDLSKKISFDSQVANQFKIALKIFMKN